MHEKYSKLKKRVFLVCSGLGRVNRGYESFTAECFENLTSIEDFELILYKGGGKREENQIVVSNIHRNSKLSKVLHKVLNIHTYNLEQLTFSIALIPHIIKKKPALIYFSDFALGTFLWHIRKVFKFHYKLLFANGAPNGPPFTRTDHIQQLLKSQYDIAMKGGTPAQMQTILPYGINFIPNKKQEDWRVIRSDAKNELGLPLNAIVILSVGALNKKHKRMDYVINEVAKLSENYFLVLLGEHEDESDEIIHLANDLLPNRHLIKTVSKNEVHKYYIAADLFVLASLREGFGRVFIEAMMYGLSCCIHNYDVTQEVLGKYGVFGDLSKENALSNLISNLNISPNEEQVEYIKNCFSWTCLKLKYKKLILSQISE